MKQQIEIVKAHQAWRTHKCECAGGCGKTECKMPDTAPTLLTAAIDDVLKAAERYEKIRKLSPREFSDLWMKNVMGGDFFDDLVDAL